jgi:hypothetical protein
VSSKLKKTEVETGPGDTMFNVVQPLLEALLNMSLRSACIIDKNFPGKSKISSLGTTVLKCEIFKINELVDIGLREFC